MIRIRLARKQHPATDVARTESLVRILEQGTTHWNRWRDSNTAEYIDLRNANFFGKSLSLRGANLRDANLSQANFAKVDLSEADLSAVYAVETDFQGAVLQGANLQGAYLQQSNFCLANMNKADLRLTDLSNCNLLMADCNGANLRKARLHSAQVVEASFSDAILAESDLSDSVLRHSDFTRANMAQSCLDGVSLVETDLQGAILTGCRVFGTSVWKSNLDGSQQGNLIITPEGEPEITVDNIKVAQFIYLILNNNEIRDVIDTITSKVVLIIGRFTPERKEVLDAIRRELLKWNYTPVMFDFDRPVSKNFIETVSTLAGMSRFIIADVTDAKVVLQELHTIVRDFPSVPVQPLLLRGAEGTEVLLDFVNYSTFLAVHVYGDCNELVSSIGDKIITPAEQKTEEIRERRKRAEELLTEMRPRA